MNAPEPGTERSVPLKSAAEQAAPRDKVAEKNMELMQTLDDAWNEQNVEVFRARHKPDVIVRWPGNPKPTVGIEDHTQEAYDFWKTFPDQRLANRPYRIFFASGDFTCSVARMTGTMKGPMKAPDGSEIPPTGKSVRCRLLHGREVGQWPDRRGEPHVRPGHVHEADRPEQVAGCSRSRRLDERPSSGTPGGTND